MSAARDGQAVSQRDATTFLEGRRLNKHFPGVHAVRDVDIRLQRGVVHVLVGENGAGKSTLVKMFSGAYRPDSGTLLVDGEPVGDWNARVALEAGISTIYQEFNLVPDLTVMENIFLNREPVAGPFGIARRRDELRRRTVALLARLNVDIRPDARVSRLGVAQRQTVEIAKALSPGNERLLMLDEPTAALSANETQQLFQMIRLLTAQGVAVLYISHRLEEIPEIGDVVTVMRDGAVVGDELPTDIDQGELIRLMVGRDVEQFFVKPADRTVREEKPRLRVLSASLPPSVVEASFELRPGEIVGLFGLIGAGRTELVRAIVGADRLASGRIEVDGTVVSVPSPAVALKLGMGLAPEDRKRAGIVPDRGVRDNIVLSALGRLSRGGVFLNDRLIEETCRRYVQRLTIRTPSLQTRIRNLSGGNQQKIILARLLTADTDTIIFDEPTRGIDVGARHEIYELMAALAADGKAVLVVSSDLEEVIGISHRLLVMRAGRIAGELRAEEIQRERILELALPQAASG